MMVALFLTHILCTLSSLSILIPHALTNNDVSVSINCAHLHPQYGIQTPEEQLAELKREEEEGEVDVNMQEYKKNKETRHVGHPTLVLLLRFRVLHHPTLAHGEMRLQWRLPLLI